MINIINSYIAGESILSLHKRTGLSWLNIKKILVDNNISIRDKSEQAFFRRVITDEEVIEQLKIGKTCAEIAIPIGCDPAAIQRKANRLNIPIKGGKRNFKTPFIFDGWTHLLAYTVGLILGDGSISFGPKIYQISVNAATNQLDNLKNLSDLWGGRTIFPVGKNLNRIILGSKDMLDFLVSIGINKVKRDNNKLPNIPDVFWGTFLCGWFDADGSAYLKEKNLNRPQWELVSMHHDWLSEAKDKIKLFTDVTAALSPGHATFRLRIGKYQDVKTVSQFMYSNTPIAIQYKKQRLLP